MAETPLQQTMDAPWIFFEPQAAGTVAFDVNKHITGCVHRLMDSKVSSEEGASPGDQLQTERLVHELCGLAGVAPVSRDQTGWTGSVVFRETQPQKALHAQVSYSVNQAGLDVSPTDLEVRTLGVLRHLCLALWVKLRRLDFAATHSP